MKRGEIWTVSGSTDYAGKPRPVVIVQDDSFDAQIRSRFAPSPRMKRKRLYSDFLLRRMNEMACVKIAA